MDTEKMKAARRDMEAAIYKLLREFEAAHGMRVTSVILKDMEFSNLGKGLIAVHCVVELPRE